MFDSFDQVAAFIHERSINAVDLKFTGLGGQLHHVTLTGSHFTPEVMESGIGFDASSVNLKAANMSDMVLVPDLSTGFLDPFWDVPTLSFFCVILSADTREIFPSDPRNIAKFAEEYLKRTGIADSSLWGPEFEFYILDSVSYENSMNAASYRMDSVEAEWNSPKIGNGYFIHKDRGYHAIPPQDHLFNLRNQISLQLEKMDVEVKYHHHEVGGPGQCEIEIPMLPLLKAADKSLLIKYVTRMSAFNLGMTATFMPKPLYGVAGSGMHFHQQLWKRGVNLFYDPEGYGAMSELARYYIGGLLSHCGSVMAFTNPSTNSYRRLVPGYEAPINVTFSVGSRLAAIRIPKYANKPILARFEFRPPDSTSNPYMAMAVQLLAGIDGILRKIDPTRLGFGPIEGDIPSRRAEKKSETKKLPVSLGQAMDMLEVDHDFLLVGEIFSKDIIEEWIERKRKEDWEMQSRPHPYEIELYYNV